MGCSASAWSLDLCWNCPGQTLRLSSSRGGDVAVGLDGEHLAPLGVAQRRRHVAAAVVVGEHHEMVRAILPVPVGVPIPHIRQRPPHHLRRCLRDHHACMPRDCSHRHALRCPRAMHASSASAVAHPGWSHVPESRQPPTRPICMSEQAAGSPSLRRPTPARSTQPCCTPAGIQHLRPRHRPACSTAASTSCSGGPGRPE